MIKKSCMKKAQAQIITTILIILLVLAAVVIVWQVVNKSIKESSDQIIAGISCTNLNVIVSKADSSTKTVLITRNPGASKTNVTGLVLYVNGEKVKEKLGSLDELQTYVFVGITLTAGDKVQVATKIGKNACPLSAEIIAVDSGGAPACKTCDSTGFECGLNHDDGCGGLFDCGNHGNCISTCRDEVTIQTYRCLGAPNYPCLEDQVFHCIPGVTRCVPGISVCV